MSTIGTSFFWETSGSLPLVLNSVVQMYSAIGVRNQVKQLFTWHPKNRKKFTAIHEENEKIPFAKNKLKKSKHASLFHQSRALKILVHS